MICQLFIVLLLTLCVQPQIINVITNSNGQCSINFGFLNNVTCPKLQKCVMNAPLNCQTNCSGKPMSLSISSDSANLNFSIYVTDDVCNMACGQKSIPFDVLLHLKRSVTCGFAPDGIKARMAVDFLCPLLACIQL
jgi:hypothetical protein